ncbi:uncharacterized protein LOC112493896 [Cephus cinctus]|uniref:Uncharacterized protein LOC112493896 n=1 Tax=Cephus cinctus TaxID=211228 RepID=A0AAJ7RBI5_CEPCN|nr:uncharacterized protein LOC112493896 [Cephus cinctus]
MQATWLTCQDLELEPRAKNMTNGASNIVTNSKEVPEVPVLAVGAITVAHIHVATYPRIRTCNVWDSNRTSQSLAQMCGSRLRGRYRKHRCPYVTMPIGPVAAVMARRHRVALREADKVGHCATLL